MIFFHSSPAFIEWNLVAFAQNRWTDYDPRYDIARLQLFHGKYFLENFCCVYKNKLLFFKEKGLRKMHSNRDKTRVNNPINGVIKPYDSMPVVSEFS